MAATNYVVMIPEMIASNGMHWTLLAAKQTFTLTEIKLRQSIFHQHKMHATIFNVIARFRMYFIRYLSWFFSFNSKSLTFWVGLFYIFPPIWSFILVNFFYSLQHLYQFEYLNGNFKRILPIKSMSLRTNAWN